LAISRGSVMGYLLGERQIALGSDYRAKARSGQGFRPADA
jgi:hypothetical protein